MRICEVIADKKYKRILITIAEKQGAIDYWWSSDLEDGRQIFTMVVTCLLYTSDAADDA